MSGCRSCGRGRERVNRTVPDLQVGAEHISCKLMKRPRGHINHDRNHQSGTVMVRFL